MIIRNRTGHQDQLCYIRAMIMRSIFLSVIASTLLLNACRDVDKRQHSPAKLSDKDSTAITQLALEVIHEFDGGGDYNRAKAIIDSAKHHLDSIGFSHSAPMSAILNLEAVYWQRRYNNRDTAIAILESALSMSKSHHGDHSPELGDVLVNLSVMHRENRNYTRSEELAEQALIGFETDSLKYRDEMVATLINLAVTHSYKEDFEQALAPLYRAMKLVGNGEANSKTRKAELYAQTAGVYADMKRFDKALEYRKYAMDLYESMEPLPTARLATSYSNMGILCSDLGQHGQALEYYKKAESLCYTAYGDSTPRLATLWDNMAHEYRVSGMVDSAIALHRKAQQMEFRHFQKDDYHISKGRSLLALAYNDAGLHKKALYELKLALKADEKREGFFSETVGQHHMNISSTYNAMGRPAYAYAHLDTATAIQDSVVKIARIDALTEMAERFETEKKNSQIALLTAKNKERAAQALAERNKRLLTMGISGSLIIILLGGGFFIQRNRKQKHQVEITRAELEKKVVETDFLRSQLDPHFIKNALINVDRLLAEGKTEEAQRYNDRFRKLMNLTLDNAREQLVGLDEELDMMEQYLALEADRLENRLQWSVSVADDVRPEEIELPPMILQPLVENALKHGADLRSGKGEVKLDVRVENERILCVVEDNGSGISSSPLDPPEGETASNKVSHGLRITRERLEMFSNLNLADARLELLETGSGTRAVVSFVV